MNYYEHHIRDYDAAASHLSWDEDLAYTRLLRWYYRKEQPIPADVKEACRQVRATTKAQRAAVSAVLKEFFELRADGWHQETCDRVIAEFQAGEPERELKKVNEDNRLKRHRDERARLFKIITDAGLHAPWNMGMGELRALAEQASATFPETPIKPLPETAPATPATATQSPDTTPHTPEGKEGSTSIVSGSRADPDDDFAPKDPAEWCRYWRDRHGVELDPSNVHDRRKAWPLFAAWTTAGITAAQMDAAVRKAKAEAKDSIAFLPAYVDRVLASMQSPQPAQHRMTADEQRRAISDANGAAWLAQSQPSDPNVIDMET